MILSPNLYYPPQRFATRDDEHSGSKSAVHIFTAIGSIAGALGGIITFLGSFLPVSDTGASARNPPMAKERCIGADGAWARAETTNTRQGFEVYLGHYGACRYADIAQDYINDFDRETARLAQEKLQLRLEDRKTEQLERQRKSVENRRREDQEREAQTLEHQRKADEARRRIAQEQAALDGERERLRKEQANRDKPPAQPGRTSCQVR